MLLKPVPVSSDKFHWDTNTRQYIAEISDLGIRQFGRVYDDAVDEGLTLLGKNRDVVFVVDHIEVKDGDLLFWTLMPAGPVGPDANLRQVATMTIFND